MLLKFSIYAIKYFFLIFTNMLIYNWFNLDVLVLTPSRVCVIIRLLNLYDFYVLRGFPYFWWLCNL